jgi:hypothetical protein
MGAGVSTVSSEPTAELLRKLAIDFDAIDHEVEKSAILDDVIKFPTDVDLD